MKQNKLSYNVSWKIFGLLNIQKSPNLDLLHVFDISVLYTCQLFLRYKREIFILWVLGFFKTTRSFPKIPEEVRRSSEDVRSLPKTSEVCRRRSYCFSLQKSEIARKVLSFIHFTHSFRSLHGSDLTYFWKLCQARRQQLTFFNQAWEIGPQAWAGVRSKFSTRRRETHAQGVRVGTYSIVEISLSSIA